MTEIPIRELRNHGGDVADRVLSGEPITVTRAGKPVMELRPVPQPSLSAGAILERWRHLPHIDHQRFRDDLANVFDDAV